MKRKLFILLILLIMPIHSSVCFASSDVITAIENSMFGYDYKNEPNNVRVERIESYLYGAKKTGSIQNRIKDIQNDMGLSLSDDKSKNKDKKKNPDLKSNMNPAVNNELMNLKEDSSVDYPIVDEMEKELFNTTYKSENIYKRLDRLEERVFNSKSNASLNERVDNLASVMSPTKIKKRKKDMYSNYNENELDSYYSNSGLENIDDQSIPFQVAVLEQSLLNNNYNNDNIATRLSRLEQKLFKRTFQNDADITRLQRIMVAFDAKKNSYKYENNQKMQKMATVSQLGGILLMILAILL